MMSCARVLTGAAVVLLLLTTTLSAADVKGRQASSDLSAQERRGDAQVRPRIYVYPERRSFVHRECVAVFQERWIPAWGGWVLRPGQQCWWTRSPL